MHFFADFFVRDNSSFDHLHVHFCCGYFVDDLLRKASLLGVIAECGADLFGCEVCLGSLVGVEVDVYFICLAFGVSERKRQNFVHLSLFGDGAVQPELFLIFVNVIGEEIVLVNFLLVRLPLGVPVAVEPF
jgi:hypothetical protein